MKPDSQVASSSCRPMRKIRKNSEKTMMMMPATEVLVPAVKVESPVWTSLKNLTKGGWVG